ncbi:MAG TPA: hypothetical protein VJ964_15165, partial [Balneolaceae bacterium]|nr:hypothetical protein [Balneolaceae bacterium]
HTMQDTPQNLSLASLQHQGSNLLHNVRHFGNTDFDITSSSEYVYFNNATGGITYYPAGWSFPLALITAILFVAYLVFLFRTNQISIGRYIGSLGLFLGILIVGTALTYFSWRGFEWLHPEYQWLLMGENYSHSWYLWGFSLLNLGIFCGIYGWIQKKLTTQQLLTGSFTVWVLISLIAAWYLPTASYLFTWPVLMALIGWIVLGNQITNNSWKSILVLGISLSGTLFIIPPYIYLVQIMLTTKMIAVSMLLLLLTIGLCWAMVWQIIRNRKVIWNSGLMLGAVACFLAATLNSGFDAQHKKQNDINYVQNLNANKAYWVSRNYKADSWTGQFLGADFKHDTLRGIKFFGNRSVLFNAAQPLEMPPPTFEVLSDSSVDSLRFVKLQIKPGQDGIGVQTTWEPKNSIAEVKIRDKTIYSRLLSRKNQAKNLHNISYFQDLSDPVVMEFAYNPQKQPTVFFDFVKPGLPTQLVNNYTKRSPDMMPALYPVTNSTIWQMNVDLDTLEIKN